MLPKRFWYAIAIVATEIIAVQLRKAYAYYFHLGPYKKGPGQIDSHFRWQEVQYVLRGENPFDVAFANIPRAHAVQPPQQAFSLRNARPDPELGLPVGTVYPPWAYPTEFLFFWPREQRQASI